MARQMAEPNVAADLLAASFGDDPFYRWMTPDPRTRHDALRAYFLDKLRGGDGNTFISDRGHSVLIAREVGTMTRHLPDDIPALTAFVDAAHRRRILRVFERIDRVHPRAPHLYIDVIATHPAERGRGDGTLLLNQWIAGRGNRLIHLQSSNEQNLSFYRRLGFVPEPLCALPHGAGYVTPMNRPPFAGDQHPRAHVASRDGRQ